MARLKYPEDWLGPESIALIINYAELTKLAKANGLDSGHLSYLVRQLNETALGTINRMVESGENRDPS